MSDARQETGNRGERLARNYLQDEGYRILETNLENDRGEIDLLAYEPPTETFVFVEVRTRRGGRLHGEASIGRRKVDKITASAKQFLARRDALQVPHRFDVIGVTLHDDEAPELRHHEAAFST